MESLKGILEDLRNGGELVLETYPGLDGKEIPVEILMLDRGRWEVFEVVCMSSELHGLGSCKCKEHRASVAYKVSRSGALKKIKSYLYAKKLGEKGYTVEIEWLEKAIKELETLENENICKN